MYINPIEHAKKMQSILESLKGHCRSESVLFTDPKAQALYETAANVMDGLEKAFNDYALHSGEAWKEASMDRPDPQHSAEPWD